mmetsp:Transcript_23074/g.31613  ORF Transcript_23074/g.31613 Transcript_23074/m.31613 type:complete len:234 (+) Transcript_23074:969-1670(+)
MIACSGTLGALPDVLHGVVAQLRCQGEQIDPFDDPVHLAAPQDALLAVHLQQPNGHKWLQRRHLLQRTVRQSVSHHRHSVGLEGSIRLQGQRAAALQVGQRPRRLQHGDAGQVVGVHGLDDRAALLLVPHQVVHVGSVQVRGHGFPSAQLEPPPLPEVVGGALLLQISIVAQDAHLAAHLLLLQQLLLLALLPRPVLLLLLTQRLHDAAQETLVVLLLALFAVLEAFFTLLRQ